MSQPGLTPEGRQPASAGRDPAPAGAAPPLAIPAEFPDLDAIRYDANGLVTAVVQDAADGQVLMVAYMNKEALRRTLTSGRTCFWSRSRREFWVKGETSGNTQRVVRVAADCDNDCILVVVEQKGVACHTGSRSCFSRELRAGSREPIPIDTSGPIFQITRPA